MNGKSAQPGDSSVGARPGLAVLCGEITPYRLHFHRRIARELPELNLWSVLFRDSAWSAWKLPDDPSINLVKLAEGDFAAHRTRSGGVRSQLRRSAATIDFLRSHNIAAVLVNGYDELPQLRAIRWCRAQRIPVLLWADSNIRADTSSKLKRLAKRLVVPRIIRRCDALLPCGSLGRDYFLRYGASPSRVFYSPVEPDYDQLQGLDTMAVESLSRRFGLAFGRYRFVVSSRLVDYKRVDMAIDAFLRIADRVPSWDLVILGDGPLAASLRNRAAGSSRITFTGFIGEQEAVTAIYRASHILVHPSSYEPWALVINEAAAAGMAIVSTDVVGAAAELVRDGVNGRVVPVNSLEALSNAMLDAASPDHLVAYRQGSARVLSDWRKTADPIKGLRKALVATKVLRPA
jgi:glycosyltransferase involved in cell wall biosynthesis